MIRIHPQFGAMPNRIRPAHFLGRIPPTQTAQNDAFMAVMDHRLGCRRKDKSRQRLSFTYWITLGHAIGEANPLAWLAGWMG